MSIIVKGMEMPTCCEWCEVENFEQNSDGYIIDSWCPVISNEPSTLKIRRESRHSLCPLRPLPEKHGRLIDADALGAFPYNMSFCDGGEADEWIEDAPTIVEAEGDIGVKPVVRGQWIWRHRHRGGFRRVTGEDDFGVRHTITVDERYQIDDPYCPFCGKLNESVFLNYCPNCGADMRDDKP